MPKKVILCRSPGHLQSLTLDELIAAAVEGDNATLLMEACRKFERDGFTVNGVYTEMHRCPATAFATPDGAAAIAAKLKGAGVGFFEISLEPCEASPGEDHWIEVCCAFPIGEAASLSHAPR